MLSEVVVDLSTRDQVLSGLRERGFAPLDGVSEPGDLVRLVAAFAVIIPHRDSAANGLTTIADRGEPAGDGYLGFTARALDPHTDRSSASSPPALLIMSCARAAAVGGECVLVDGKAVYQDLALSHPDAIAALSTPRSVLFGGAAGHLGATFTHVGGRVLVRLRTDSLARFSPEATRWLPTLQSVIDRHAQLLQLAPGQGYVVDNHRWLHGRRPFTGTRVLHRIHANPVPKLEFCSGFPTTVRKPR